MQNDDCLQTRRFILKQFLCNTPVKEICWQNFSNLSLDAQKELINDTVRSDSVLKYPINVEYQKAFLKHLLQFLERQDSVIDDSLYEEYARLVALPHNNINFKHYALDLEKGTKSIILKEGTFLISEGTTGLITWQASLALSEWILTHTSHFDSKVVLELGSGIGLTGLVLSLHCKPQVVYLTDCHPSVLTTLCDNVILNSSSASKSSYNVEEQFLLKENVNTCVVNIVNLPWEDISSELCQRLGHIDTIVAADIVYDDTIFECLLNTIDSLFEYCGTTHFILSCTERNPDTLSDFLKLLRRNYKIDDIDVPQQKNFFWPTVSTIKIFSITPLI